MLPVIAKAAIADVVVFIVIRMSNLPNCAYVGAVSTARFMSDPHLARIADAHLNSLGFQKFFDPVGT